MGYPEDNFKGAKGKRFGEGQTWKGNGRKPNRLKELTQKYNISSDDINNIFKNILFPHTFGELQEMIASDEEKKIYPAKDLPVLEVMIISACLQDIKKGSLMSVMQILDRVIGKPTQKDIVEFSDIPDSAKDRIDQIFAASQKKAALKKPDKPKTPSKRTKRKKEEEE
jgi:Mor family transcriptional regulator